MPAVRYVGEIPKSRGCSSWSPWCFGGGMQARCLRSDVGTISKSRGCPSRSPWCFGGHAGKMPAVRYVGTISKSRDCLSWSPWCFGGACRQDACGPICRRDSQISRLFELVPLVLRGGGHAGKMPAVRYVGAISESRMTQAQPLAVDGLTAARGFCVVGVWTV